MPFHLEWESSVALDGMRNIWPGFCQEPEKMPPKLDKSLILLAGSGKNMDKRKIPMKEKFIS